MSADAARLHPTLASWAEDNDAELDTALEVLGLLALKGEVVTSDALHCNRRTVEVIYDRGGGWCLALMRTEMHHIAAREGPGRPCARAARMRDRPSRVARIRAPLT